MLLGRVCSGGWGGRWLWVGGRGEEVGWWEVDGLVGGGWVGGRWVGGWVSRREGAGGSFRGLVHQYPPPSHSMHHLALP